jgi:FMN hydrolase / 5-amino-6-(5-phospho-D-ribitylamino)uracil phosphatase
VSGVGAGRIQAVTFDYWNTLVWEEPGYLRGRRLASWAGILEEWGRPVDPDRLAAASDRSWERWNSRWEAGDAGFGSSQALDMVLSDLGLEPSPDVRADLAAVYAAAGRDAELHLAEGAEASLRSLRAAGLRLGIVCDVGFTPSPVLRHHLERWGVLELFDHWSFSDEVGAYKPHRAPFDHALRGLGEPDPARTAHVGDRLRTDVAGARAMGMVSVRYAGLFDDPTDGLPEADLVVRRHAEIPAALGVA